MKVGKEAKVLILSPHVDDAEIGCGASIVKYIENGVQVKIIVFAAPEPESANFALKEEFLASMKVLGVEDFVFANFKIRHFLQKLPEITDMIYRTIEEYQPDILYIPALNSRHEDHAAIARAGYRATGRLSINVLGYHILGDGVDFKPTFFEVVEKRHMLKQIEAIRKYATQYNHRSYFSDDSFEAALRYYSSMTEYERVEPFEVMKWIRG